MSTKTKTEAQAKPAAADSNGHAQADELPVTKNELDTLRALKDGKAKTHKEIATVTRRPKGNRLRELTSAGFVETETPDQEGSRGHVFKITREGKEVLKKAEKIEQKLQKASGKKTGKSAETDEE